MAFETTVASRHVGHTTLGWASDRLTSCIKAGRTLEDETGRDQDGTVSARPRS